MNKRWIRIGAWTFAALLATGTLVWAFMPAPVEVEVVTVTRGAFRKTVDEDGKTRVRER